VSQTFTRTRRLQAALATTAPGGRARSPGSGLRWAGDVAARLGLPQRADDRLRHKIDALAGTPSLLCIYPSALTQAGGCIAGQVKLEFGALTDQQPTGTHGIAALQAQTPWG
jgi:hypothetical protein